MTLRVYFITNDGSTNYIDYDLVAKNYKGILKTEIREDFTKVKAWSGSKYVGIPEIDNPPIVKKSKESQYEIFNYKIHDTDREHYLVSALCSNCNETTQVVIQQKQKIYKKSFKSLVCPKCVVSGGLHYAIWNGIKYVRSGNG